MPYTNRREGRESAKIMDRIDLYTSIVPNRRQLIIQDMKYYAFVHYGINTFTNREWGNGKENETLLIRRSKTRINGVKR